MAVIELAKSELFSNSYHHQYFSLCHLYCSLAKMMQSHKPIYIGSWAQRSPGPTQLGH